jgi:dsRNA-specific ribonuclease
MARNLKAAFQAYLASSGANNWLIDATISEKDLLGFSARQEKAVANSVHSILICPRNLIQRLSINLIALELLVHVGHLSNAADLAHWLQFIDDRAEPASSRTARLIIACQPKRCGQTKDAISRYEMLSSSDFDVSCGSYFDMFGLHQNAALYQQQRLESDSISLSRHQLHTAGTFTCSLDAMWQVVHRYLHFLADSDLRSGDPTKLQWSSPTKMSSHDSNSSPLYIISATPPIHAAVGPHFESSPQPSLEACKRSVIQSIFTDLVNANALNMHMSPSFRSLPSPHSTSAKPNRKLAKFRQSVPKLSTPFDMSTQDGIEGHVLSEMLLKLVWKEGPELGHLHSAFLLLSAESLFSDHPTDFECLDRDHVKYVCSMETIGSLFVSNEQLEELKNWHTKLFGLIKLSSTSLGIDWNNSSHKYLIVPCELIKTPDGMLTLPTSPTIDWKVIQQTRDGFERDDWQSWPGSYVYYEHEPAQRYLVKEIDFGRSPRSPCRTHPESTVAEAVFLKHKKVVQDLNQPLAKVKLVSCKPFNALLRQANLRVPKDSTLERGALVDANPYQFVDLVPELLSIFIKTGNTPHESILILPSLLCRLEAFLRTQHFYNSVGLEFIPLNLALTSLTTASASENTDLEVLETVGDMVLKLFVHTHIVFAYPRMTRWHYEHYRRFWISNKYQCQLAVDRELDLWMNANPFCGKHFLPGFRDLPAPQMPSGLTEKHVADCMEAILGACYQAGGLDGAAKCLQSIGLGGILFPQLRPEPLMKYYPSQFEHFKLLENVLGYEWKDKSLVLESLSHESFDGLALLSFHRLGLIGDALFDYFLVINHAAKVMPNATPGDLTYLKSIAVCGYAQSVIAHRMGLASFLLHRSPKLVAHLSQFSSALNAIDMPNIPFWRLSSLDLPEALPMCLEAIVGAVFVDSGFNIDVTWRVFEPHFAPFWNLYVRPGASFWPKTTMANLSIRLNCSKYAEFPARRLHLSRAFAVETQYHQLKAIGIASSKRIAQSDAAARLLSIIIADKTPEETLIDRLQQHCLCQRTVDREEGEF